MKVAKRPDKLCRRRAQKRLLCSFTGENMAGLETPSFIDVEELRTKRYKVGPSHDMTRLECPAIFNGLFDDLKIVTLSMAFLTILSSSMPIVNGVKVISI